MPGCVDREVPAPRSRSAEPGTFRVLFGVAEGVAGGSVDAVTLRGVDAGCRGGVMAEYEVPPQDRELPRAHQPPPSWAVGSAHATSTSLHPLAVASLVVSLLW